MPVGITSSFAVVTIPCGNSGRDTGFPTTSDAR